MTLTYEKSWLLDVITTSLEECAVRVQRAGGIRCRVSAVAMNMLRKARNWRDDDYKAQKEYVIRDI